jgi:multiple sugar transport system ATP-binding protein
MTMGDRVAVMRKGELQQVATPQELYDTPVNLFVGGFIGSPAMNMLEATLERSNGSLVAVLGEQRLTIGEEALSSRPALRAYEGRPVIVGLRPEHLEDASHSDAPADRRLTGEVVLREALGSEIMVHFRVRARQALTEDIRELAQDAGDERSLAEAAGGSAETVVVGRFNARSGVREGETAEVAVDTGSLHFFDPDSGLGIYADTKGAA